MIKSKDIKILKQNKVYRIADVVLRKGMRWQKDRHTILTNIIYRDTILYDYLTQMMRENDFQTLKRVVWEHIENKKNSIPAEDELVVHMRLGDIAERPNRYRECLLTYDSFSKKIPFEKIGVSSVTVVTALHFGANELTNEFFYSEVAKERSLKILKDVDQQLNAVGLNTRVQSSEYPDEDFAYMAASTYFVKGKTSFSEIIVSCLKPQSRSFDIPMTKGARKLIVLLKQLGASRH